MDPEALVKRSRSFGPWTSEHVLRLLAVNAFGLMLIAVGWYEADVSDSVRTQLAWLNGAVVGLITSGVANGAWLLRGRKAIGLARLAVLAQPVAPRTGADAPSTTADAARFVSVEGTSRYHRPDCLLTSGKHVEVALRSDHEMNGRRACEVCEP